MPIRFHRSIKLFPGMRLNFSKKGIGASFGPRGMRVSIGPSGTRKTASLLGTGLSFYQQSGKSGSFSQGRKSTADRNTASQPPSPKKPMPLLKKIGLWAAGIVIGIPTLITLISMALGIPVSTPTPTPTITRSAMFIFDAPTPTITPFLTVTLTPAVAAVSTTQPSTTVSTQAGCNCTQDYNCSDFSTHQQAQACFTSCGGSATNNWSHLDGTDHDGLVCETLP